MEKLIDLLYEKFQKKGFLSEDEILLEFDQFNISFIQIEYVTKILLSKGVMISSGEDSLEEEEVQSLDRARLDYNVVYDKILENDSGLSGLIEYVRKIRPPQFHEIDALLPQVKSGNEYAKNRLFEMHIRLALKMAYQKSLDYELTLADTIQDAMTGLFVSIDKYDSSKHGSFPPYASLWITNHINFSKKIRNTLWDIPLNKQKVFDDIYDYLIEYCPSFFERPVISHSLLQELSKLTALEENEILGYLHLEMDFLDFDDSKTSSIDDFLETVHVRKALDNAFASLDEKELFVVKHVFFDDLTYAEIGTKMNNVSREWVRQIFDRASRKLQKKLIEFKNFSL